MTEILAALGSTVLQVAGWFMQVLNQTGGLGVWLTAIIVTITYKFLLAPVFGAARSDLAKHSYNAFKRGKEE